jgi:hypothetical protein
MTPKHGAIIALLIGGHLIFPAEALAGQQGPFERASSRALFDAPIVTTDTPQSSPMAPHSQSGGKILKGTLIGAALGATVMTTLAYVQRDCGNCSWGAGKAMLKGAVYGGLIGVAVGASLQRRPSPNRRAIVHPTVTPRVKAVSVQVRF